MSQEKSFYEGLKFCKVGYKLSDISHAIQTYVEDNGFSIVKDYVGHGIGTSLHEDSSDTEFTVFRGEACGWLKEWF